MAFFETKGIRLHYQRYGSKGPNVVLLHGLAANIAFWHTGVIPMLAKDYRVLAFDLRGHGLSSIPASGYTVEDFAEDLHALLEGLGLDEVHLVGHSMGGAVSLMYAILHPEKVNTMTLVDARIHAVQPLLMPREDRYWKVRRAKMKEKGIDVPDDIPKVVYSMLEELTPFLNSDKARDNISGLLLSRGGWNPRSRSAQRWKKLVTETTFKYDILKLCGLTIDRIAKVAPPTLLTYGGDSFCLDTCRGLEKLIPDCRTVIHPGLGHFYPVVEPLLVVKELRRFFTLESELCQYRSQAVGNKELRL